MVSTTTRHGPTWFGQCGIPIGIPRHVILTCCTVSSWLDFRVHLHHVLGVLRWSTHGTRSDPHGTWRGFSRIQKTRNQQRESCMINELIQIVYSPFVSLYSPFVSFKSLLQMCKSKKGHHLVRSRRAGSLEGPDWRQTWPLAIFSNVQECRT